ncbi:HAMP domain-containing protein [Candidatus Lucifugimonas marina]|jgi:signal transduction histidine kinase|uniref:histidine kinase n=2 Tax=Candidatus Lucifugimonas marina TaxID=3038979 RepID=A0AAJ5ZFN9_9CHLR|nr:HAMP domain-containing protein [SAR202 cluster bacterium JH702]MDG0868641.1 HAMP domain-containing protein [SAR202 cluster bacterium JH639]WFG35274.1 HAMP domain-containing protein [SAR202 cluster bacterium JH545]WFG39224.1 HAMP domain-containing protein [SAR202 cluster bacterium JH1073]
MALGTVSMLKWFFGLQGRLTLGFALVLALSIASVSAYSAYATRVETERFAAEIELARAERAEQLVKDTFEANQDWDEVQYAVQQVGNLFGWRVAIELDSGLIVADSHKLVRDSQGSFETTTERFTRPARFTKRPVIVNGELIGYMLVDERPSRQERPLSMQDFSENVFRQFLGDRSTGAPPPPRPTQIASPTTENLVAEVLEYVDPPLSNLQSSFQRSLVVAGIAAGFAGLLIVMLLTRQALAPVRNLTTAASSLGAGDLSQRVPESGTDEIGILANTFNTMASDLELAVDQRRQLTADVAHELRTPLTNIQGYLEAIKDGVVDADDETIDTLHSQTIHLANLIEDLRILAVADAGALALNMSHGSPVPVIEDSAAHFKQRARERNIELNISSNGTETAIDFDETRLRQIVSNLVENALTHTPNNGRISVSTEGHTEGLDLEISDSGIGISEDDIPRIFDQFYRADQSRTRATGGAGLGLTIVKRLVEAHNGDISVISGPATGTTFKIVLPISRI